MSWLNNSLNSIKGQLTTLAQEVMAETAGPGDDDYVAKTESDEAQAALAVLADTQQQCVEKDAEIAVLRKQIAALQNKISDSGGGGSGRTSKSSTEQNVATATATNSNLEDSWCWEPDNAIKSDNDRCSETSSGNGAEMVNITLEEVPLGASSSSTVRSTRNNSKQLQQRIQQLEHENQELNVALEELDTQHNQAMQNVLELKTELSTQLSSVTKDYEALKKEHAEKFISGELELGRLKKQFELLQQQLKSAENQKTELLQKNDAFMAEVKHAMEDLSDLQAFLEKKDKDNVELIERIKAANKYSESVVEERNAMQLQYDQLSKQFEELKTSTTTTKEKKTSESSNSGGSSGKHSEDEFIVVREADAGSSGPTTPPSKEEMKDKIVQLENRLSELTLENGSLSLKLQDCEMEKELSSNVLKQNLKELQHKLDQNEGILVATKEELEEQHEKLNQMKERAADAIIAHEQVKALSEEKLKIEQEIVKMQELLKKSSELERRLLLSEQEKEALQLEMQPLRASQERVLELEHKLQYFTCENQQLKLNAEAETESLNNSAELEKKIKSLTEKNESMRLELEESIAAAKFSRVIAEEKLVTDLDDDEDVVETFDYEKLRELLDKYCKQDRECDVEWLEKTYKLLRDRLWQVELLEKNVAQMSEEVLDLQDNKLVWDHEKKTLEADISQYILQCDELMKNNEILLNELENYKRNKLETISENNEENMLQLETQLEECTKLNRTLEEEYTELNEKIDELEREKQELELKLQTLQSTNEGLRTEQKDYKQQLEALELEKCNLHFELNELKSNDAEKSDETHESLQAATEKSNSLECQLERLSKDHADLVAAMQSQKSSLLDVHKKRDELEKLVQDQEVLVRRMQQERDDIEVTNIAKDAKLEELSTKLEDNVAELCRRSNELLDAKELAKQQEDQLKQEIFAKDIVAESLKTELKAFRECANESEHLKTLQNQHQTLQLEYEELTKTLEALKIDMQQKLKYEESLQEEIKTLQAQSEVKNNLHEMLQNKYDAQSTELKVLQDDFAAANSEKDNIANNADSLAQIAKLEGELLATADLQKTVDSLNFEKNEMMKALQQKHTENVQYYAEIQRLQPIIQQLQQQLANASTEKPCLKCAELEANVNNLQREHEKQLDQINFLKEKSDILTSNLMSEQTNQKVVQQEKAEVQEQNSILRKDLERLREHLLEIEDMHTQDTVETQRELEETKAKMIAMQDQVSKSSNAYTSASIRANQHAETLQAQYALVVQQRDELVAKLSLAEDRESRNQAALCNLQCALEQFQNDKEHDIQSATQRIRKELQQELDKKSQLQCDIATLQQQLTDANQGLRAATRLSDQLEACQLTIAALREEVESLKTQKHAVAQQLQHSESSQTDKIDKNLIKSLLIGYVVSGNPNDKTQVLRMISSVLDFTQSESDKVGLNKQQTSWLGAIIGGGGAGGTAAAAGSHSKDNLVQAFVQFLEQESQPKANANTMPNLLNMTQTTPPSRRTSVASNSGGAGVTGASPGSTAVQPIPIQPLLLSSNVIDEFAPSRNSSSILKDILSDS